MTKLLKEASDFIDEYREKNIGSRKKGKRYQTTKDDINKGNELLRRMIKELDIILS